MCQFQPVVQEILIHKSQPKQYRRQVDLCVVSSPDAPTPEVDENVRVERRRLDETDAGAAFIVASRLVHRADAVRAALAVVGADGFVIARESPNQAVEADSPLELLNEYCVGDEKIMLLRQVRRACLRNAWNGSPVLHQE